MSISLVSLYLKKILEMKNLFSKLSQAGLTALCLSLSLALTPALHSQSPLGISYQAVMRNADGSVMASSAVSLTFMIHDGTANGNVVYQESHTLTSNAQGLVSCVVGNGVVLQGNFAQINWGNGAKFLHVMMGSVDLGTQQMLSVSYALYAESTHLSVSTTGDTLTVGGQSVIVPGISAANPANNIPTGGLGAQVLPGNTTCANEYINVVGCNGQTSLTYDGRTYDLVEIGGQCWFADNLATDQYRNGDAIPTGLNNNAWSTSTTGAYSYFNNDINVESIYGKFYNWFAADDSRGICPTGWKVPSDCDWMYLENYLGMSIAEQVNVFGRGVDEGGKLKSTTYWANPNVGATNEVGFFALPSGYRTAQGNYGNITIYTGWWTTSEYSPGVSWIRDLGSNSSQIFRSYYSKQHGYSIRCLKDLEAPSIQGCTDGGACNFMANANQDDGSCLYQNATCDDGNANTTNDVINGSCVCAGTAVGNGTSVPGNGATDIDGNTYTSIIINGQEWMQQNLAVSKYRNGDPIPTGLSNTNWQNNTSGAYAIYNNDAANNTLYGKLYNWYAVNDSRGLCPTGWHVPSDAEWTTLETNLGGSSVAGGKMKATTGWNSPNTGATNETGFTGHPGGYRDLIGTFSDSGVSGRWLTSTENNPDSAVGHMMSFNGANVYVYYPIKQNGGSVRCVRD
jgi:uncharacterized protein (TIGR02145 family)